MRIRLFFAGLLLTIFLAPAAVYGDAFDEESAAAFMLLEEPQEETTQLPAIFLTTAPLNLRPTPCTSNPRIMLVQPGNRVEVTDFRCGEWFAVSFNGRTGYMYSAYLMDLNAFGSADDSPDAGTVELLEWNEARRLMTVGVAATVIDVRTGLSYQVAAFSNGNHSDVETLTAEDTAIMLQTFGGSWSWTTRPILVLINGRTLAASINGMPHAGSTRGGNNMNGHVCIHFLGSRTHNGTVSHERDHQNSVREAFNTASNW